MSPVIEVIVERRRQDEKFGDQTGKGPLRWFSILAEEFGEVAKEICELAHVGPTDDARRAEIIARLRKELIQTTAVGLAFLQYGDREGWWRDPGPTADDAKVRFLLDAANLWSEDGFFTFPDGDTWERQR